jgi:hypothetical protein
VSGAIPPLSQYASMAWCLVQHRGNFVFTFYPLEHPVLKNPQSVFLSQNERLNFAPTQHKWQNYNLGPNILLRTQFLDEIRTQFSDKINLRPSLRVTDQTPHPHKNMYNYSFLRFINALTNVV